MTLAGDLDCKAFVEAIKRVAKAFAETCMAIKEIIDRLYRECERELNERAILRPRVYHNAERSVMNTITLFRRHTAVIMRFHVAATGE